MKKLIGVWTLVAAFGAFAGPLDKAVLHGDTDKERAIDYAPGETMTFTITLQGAEKVPDGEYFVNWYRKGDDGKHDGGKVDVNKLPLTIKTKLDIPGFVRVNAVLVDKNGKNYRKKYMGDTTTPEGKRAMNAFERRDQRVFFDGGAGVQIDKLVSYPEPKDFDAFWAKQAERLKLIPIKADRIQIPCNAPGAKLYAVQIACAGLRPVTGYLSIPKAAVDGKKLPCRLQTHGYSGDDCSHGAPNWIYNNDEVVLNINAHGLKLPAFGATEADRKALRWETRSHDRSYAFDPKQNADPEVAYFNGMVLRVKRALQYLKTLPEWDGKNLYASGGSQGGLQTIWAAGCGEGVTLAESGITWCCDMYTSGKLRIDPSKNLASDGWYIPWTEGLGYYDAANFARRIPRTCKTVITRAGLGDYCCPPTGLAKMYNNMTCPKEIHWVQGSTHGYVPPEKHQSFVLSGK